MNGIYMNLLTGLLLFVFLQADGVPKEYKPEFEQGFIYELSGDRTVLTFYDFKWNQIYKVKGLSDLPGDIPTQGDLWYQKGFLSIRVSSNSYLSFSSDDISFPEGTSYFVQSIARYYGPEVVGYSYALKSGDMQLSEASISTSCKCIAVQDMNGKIECKAGGAGSIACEIGKDGNRCEVDCWEGFNSCCNE